MGIEEPNQSSYQWFTVKLGENELRSSPEFCFFNIFVNKLSTHFKCGDDTTIGKTVGIVEEHKWYLEES